MSKNLWFSVKMLLFVESFRCINYVLDVNIYATLINLIIFNIRLPVFYFETNRNLEKIVFYYYFNFFDFSLTSITRHSFCVVMHSKYLWRYILGTLGTTDQYNDVKIKILLIFLDYNNKTWNTNRIFLFIFVVYEIWFIFKRRKLGKIK